MKKLLFITGLLSMSLHVAAESETRLNAVEAEGECHKQIESIYVADGQVRFKPRPTSSFGGGKYRFWINATEYSGTGAESRGYLCEITRTGEVLELTQRDSRWRS